jgi:TonB-linked SusC/RagA family outer membrane protein
MKSSTLQTKSNVNISGGTKDVRYFVSVGLMTQGGLFKTFDYDQNFTYNYSRFNYRANLDLDVTSSTTISFNVAGVASNDHKPRTSEGATALIRAMYQATPFSSPGFVDGKLVYTATDYTDGLVLPYTGGSGLTYISNSGTGGSYETNLNKLQSDLQLVQKLNFITKGLDFRIKGSYNSQFSVMKETTVTRASYTPVIQSDGTIEYRKSSIDGIPTYAETNGKARDWYFEAAFNYNRQFGKNTVGALVLYNQSKTYYPSTYSDIPSGYVGLVGRLTYDYDNRYLAEFNIGRNGSENFHPDRRFGTFPAGSFGWIVSNEKFFQPIVKTFNFLKLRASVGLVGNDKVGGYRFMYMSDPFAISSTLMARGGYAYNFGVNNSTVISGYAESSKNNPNVSWEKALKQDYGFDVYFLNSNLRGTFDYYKEHRTGILLRDMTAPGYIGFSVPYANLGVVDSHGYEFSIQWNQSIGKNWRYWATLNLSTNENKIVEMKEAPQSNEYQYQKGHRVGARSMYQFFRFYDSETPALYEKTFGKPYPTQLTDLVDGDAVYVDLDGDGKITANDMTRDLGYTDDPRWVAGLNLGVVWKDLELSMQWAGAWGVSRMISDVFRQPFLSRTGNNDGGLLAYHITHTWNSDNPGQDYDYPRASWAHADNNYAESTLYEKDSKYFRLKTIQLAYTFRFPWLRKVGMRSMQAALSGYNLLTFTPYIWGDPEAVASSLPSYPLQRTYTFSLKLNF